MFPLTSKREIFDSTIITIIVYETSDKATMIDTINKILLDVFDFLMKFVVFFYIERLIEMSGFYALFLFWIKSYQGALIFIFNPAYKNQQCGWICTELSSISSVWTTAGSTSVRKLFTSNNPIWGMNKLQSSTNIIVGCRFCDAYTMVAD